MHFEGDMGCPEFPMPKVVRTVVCCDLDETYIPFNKENKINGAVARLKNFMRSFCEDLGIVLGWVTGTNLIRYSMSVCSREKSACALGAHGFAAHKGCFAYQVNRSIADISESPPKKGKAPPQNINRPAATHHAPHPYRRT